MTLKDNNVSSRTLQILSIPKDLQDETLEESFTDFGPLRRCFVVRGRNQQEDPTSSQKVHPFALGYVEFAFQDDAKRCFKESGGKIQVRHDGKLVNLGLRVVADRARNDAKGEAKGEASSSNEQRSRKDFEQSEFDRQAAKKKRARLIVRNLSFQAMDADLRSHFEKCGKLDEVRILTRPDGRRVGCAFVQFSNVAEAAKAIKELNGTDIVGRTVAVDWAVGKKEFQAAQKDTEIKKEDEETPVKIEKEEEEELDMDIKKEEEEEEDDDEEDEEDGDLEGEEEEDDDDDDDDDEYDDDDDDDDDMGSRKFGRKDQQHNLRTGHDVGEQRTVFLRNLSYDSDEIGLRDLMEDRFGKVFYARMVMDKMTEHAKGTAFVKFQDAEDAKRCVAATENDDDGLFLDDRRIFGCMALTKDDAEAERARKKEKVAKDSRNLHLAVEGLVRKGTQAAVGVSETDIEKRTKLERWKRGILKDLNMFVSPLRLCVRNLPLNFNDQRLKRLFLQHSDDKSCRVVEAKIMREAGGTTAEDGKAAGLGKSKGYGFVSFDKHEHALAVLRKLNNNPTVFGKAARPIIEFSIENRKALNARQRRLEKSRDKNPTLKDKGVAGGKTVGGGVGGAATATVAKPSAFKRKETKDEIEDKPQFMGSINNPKQRKLPSHVGEKVRHNRPAIANPKITRKSLKKAEAERKNSNSRKRKRGGGDTVGAAVVATTGGGGVAAGGGEDGSSSKKPKKNKKKKNWGKAELKDFREEKKFSALVEKYKSKLTSSAEGGGAASKKKTKWFDA